MKKIIIICGLFGTAMAQWAPPLSPFSCTVSSLPPRIPVNSEHQVSAKCVNISETPYTLVFLEGRGSAYRQNEVVCSSKLLPHQSCRVYGVFSPRTVGTQGVGFMVETGRMEWVAGSVSTDVIP